MNKDTEKNKKRGPKEDRIIIQNSDWKDAVGKALKKKRPESGWPKDKDDK